MINLSGAFDLFVIYPSLLSGDCMPYGSIFKRFIAALIDGLIVGMIAGMGSFVVSSSPWSFYSLDFVFLFGYFTLMESSEKQATLGKMVMGLKVTDMTGNRLTQQQAATRAAMRIVSSIILGIGFIVALFNDKKQTLHDQVAKTLVLKDNNEPIRID